MSALKRSALALLAALLLGACRTDEPPPTATPTTRPSPTPVAGSPQPETLTLAPDGIGVARFGEDPDVVVAAVTQRLGEPTSDSGWGASSGAFGTCPGTELRVVRWKSLFVYLGNGETSYAAAGTRHLFSYMDSRYDERGRETEPTGLKTDSGVGVGSTVSALRGAHPEAEVQDDPTFGPRWRVETPSGALFGNVTGTADTDTISSVHGGEECGE
ncbi:MAG TPA: hypothetical protein VM840_08655 [Actinomycetota bacterium]|nr:hypothetical protein [Actinomycetota bacterium]